MLGGESSAHVGQAGDNGKESALANHLQIAQIQQEIEKLRRIQNTLKSTTWLVLHKIKDDDTAYLADPSWAPKQGQQPSFKGNSPLARESQYLKHRPDAAFVVYRHYNPASQAKDVRRAIEEGLAMPHPKPNEEVIQPLSKQMIAALDVFVDLHPTFRDKFPGWRSSDPINSPFLFWYCYRATTDLQSMAKPHRTQMALLTEWIDTNYGKMHTEVEDRFSRGYVSESTMPFFIQPGEVMVSMNERGISGHIAVSWPSHDSTKYSTPSHPNKPRKVTQRWSVDVWSYGYDGSFYKDYTTLTINLEFDEDSPDASIANINILPIRFGNQDFRTKLERRGRTMWACRRRNLIAYNDPNDNSLSSEGERYMIDFNTYRQLHSDSHKFKTAYSSLTNPHRKGMDSSLMECDEPPQGAELFCFPSTIVGYNLRQKKWQDLQIDSIQELHWNKQAFRHLVIDEETKDIIQALVTSKLETDQTTDLIQGKGNGLIILLHGGPGTGKTFTAESVAELAEKPLFRVTCGDIGTKPEEVEKYLESVLHLGKIWGCVVLLDEADVFLEQRTLTDLERNALVSVFLRVLEYYEGILILTSNRVGTFDEAFKSRIQLSLHYDTLTKSQRRTIWSNFLQRLNALEKSSVVQPITDRKRKYECERGINFEDIERHLADLAEEQMNGRQIRNAITTARQLAKFKDESMTYKHLEHVIKISRKFDKYIEKVRDSYSDDQVAREDGIR
ncbi:aaa family atpase [Fusarium sporotrichioides]|uniref:Aaa family atpase n=1 Tax=Fusarium sporotrichioides TaxID=5514 RepID=A0A395S2H2_FUSSP|nr:aaa family atpase [Fusarium sporotrichioides]